MTNAAEHRDVDGPRYLTIDEALAVSKPWDWDAPTGGEDLTDEEFDAFVEALRSC